MKKSAAVPSGAWQKERNLINGSNMRHYKIINPDARVRKSLLRWPFRMAKKFFSQWRKYGFWFAVGKIPDKLKYVKKRIFKEKGI